MSFWVNNFHRGENFIVKLLLEGLVFNRKVRRIYKGNWAKRQLRPYLTTALDRLISLPTSLKEEEGCHIWQYWHTKEIPFIVRASLESVARYHPNRQLLNFASLENYLDLPGFYYDYLKQKKMKQAHFSDVVRVYLLRVYGGTWLDATIYLTAALPKYITKRNLFWFQAREQEDLDGLSMVNYLLHAVPKHPILDSLGVALDHYWKDNSFSVNYFLFSHLLTMLTQTELGRYYCRAIPFFSFIPVERLQWELFQPYSEERWEELQKMSSIHKLSYKSKVLGFNPGQKLEGTFYERLFGSSNQSLVGIR